MKQSHLFSEVKESLYIFFQTIDALLRLNKISNCFYKETINILEVSIFYFIKSQCFLRNFQRSSKTLKNTHPTGQLVLVLVESICCKFFQVLKFMILEKIYFFKRK